MRPDSSVAITGGAAPGVTPAFVIIVLTGAAFAYFATVLLVQYGFPLDDSWIHHVVARNFAVYGKSGFVPDAWASGSSSLAWTVLLTPSHLLELDPVLYSAIFGFLLYAGLGLAFFRLLCADGYRAASALVIMAAAISSGNVLWLFFISMEHGLFLLLSLAVITLWFSRFQAAAAGMAAALLAATRPEGIAILIVLALSVKAAGRSWRDLLLVVTIGSLGSALYAGFGLITSGSPLPTTMAGRRWLYGQTGFSVTDPFTFATKLLRHMLLLGFDLQFKGVRGPSFIVPLLAFCAAGLVGIVRQRRYRLLAFLGWGVVHAGFYAVLLPSISHGGRYQPLALFLLLPLAAIGILYLAELVASRLYRGARPGRVRWVGLGCAFVFSATAAALSLPHWRNVLYTGIEHINATHVTAGNFIRGNIAPGEAVASFDIGAITYVSGRPIIDLGGLVDRGYLPFLIDNKVSDYLKLKNVRYVVLPMPFDFAERDWNFGLRLGLTNRPEVKLQLIRQWSGILDNWMVASQATILASPTQALYELSPP